MESPPTFTAKQVCGALEISRGMLNNWLSDGYFKQFDAPNVSAGRPRAFSLLDLYRLAFFRVLLDHGTPARQAEGWATFTVSAMDRNQPKQTVRYSREPDYILFDSQKPKDAAVVEIVVHIPALTNELRVRLGLKPNTAARAPKRAPKRPSQLFPTRRRSVSD